MLLAFILGFLQIFSASDSTGIAEQTKSQAVHYINQIENETNVAENTWALTLLGSKNNQITSFIEEKAKQKSNALQSFQQFEDSFPDQLQKSVFQTGSADLLVALLLSVEDKNEKKKIYRNFNSKFTFPQSSEIEFKKLCKTIIQQKEITDSILTDETFLLPHFFLLYDKNYSTYFSDGYLKNITKSWRSQFSSDKKIDITLGKLSRFRALYITDQYSDILSLYNFMIGDELFPNSPLKLRLYKYLDYSMYRLAHYDKGLEIVRKRAIPLAKTYSNQSTILSLKINQATYLYDIGKVLQAKSLFEHIIAQAEKANITLPLAIIYNNLALAYYKSGEYNRYLEFQQKALNTAKSNNNYDLQINFYNNLFIYYRKFNDEQNALSYLDKASKLAKEQNNQSDLGNIYMLTGSYFREFNQDYDTAHKYFSKASKILKKNNTKRYLELLNEQAEAFEEQQKFYEALKKHNSIISLTPSINNPNRIDALINKALVNLNTGNPSKVDKLINKFKELDLNQLDFHQIIKAKTVEADYLQRTGKSGEALAILNPALKQILERARSSADLKSGFWHVEDEYLDAFELAVNIHKKMGEPGKAVKKLDQLKTINDASLYQNPLVKSSVLNESELTRYKRLVNQLDATRKKLLTATQEQQLQIRQRINKLKIEKNKLDNKLTNVTEDQSFSVNNVQKKLSAKEQVLHITELNNQYYITNISRSDIRITTVSLDSTLRNKLSNVVHQVASNKTNLDSLYTITKLLGIDELPARLEQLTIIPDRYLYQLPVDILPVSKPDKSYSYGQTTYAIEQFRTRYLTSLSDFFNRRKQRIRTKNNFGFVGYGISNFDNSNNQSLVPLPYAQEEVTAIKNSLTHLNNARTVIDQNATKENFTRTAPRTNILHMATHSAVSERDPMFSSIYMTNTQNTADSTFNSQIFAYELFELNLNNEMIMLNSCESGSGSYIQGSGIMGMSRALRYAGANTLVLNLWSVNDMLASDFATYFYKQLNKGVSKTEALRDTKIHFLETKNASPHFWGVYMLIGNDDPIVKPNRDTNIAVAGAFLFFFIVTTGLSFLKDQGIINRNNSQKAA